MAESMIVRWINSLVDFKFVIQHIVGERNVITNFLSRQNELVQEALPTIRINEWQHWAMVDCPMRKDILSKVHVKVKAVEDEEHWLFCLSEEKSDQVEVEGSEASDECQIV
eukprot:CAMPEP_0113847648 /NCGR_PEP_ID=MMETSP0372-20130328/1999_1 /TAXON_ID=340204 /ORGANISM="Lankesteria abbotti" /LENGTH=110 /DNA_ID=CAMNT_0000816965 /DNA_START=63 /DNA_END=395 /DNA_ORIENTATION=+ /assembly_acc=CAM_ASM_000359